MTGRLIGRRAALAGIGAAGVAAALPLGAARAQETELALGIFTQGDPEAPVEVIEFASLTCPHCASFHTEVYPQIKRDYIDTGKIRLEFREVYFDRLGLYAGMLARCGGEDRYFGFISLLLERQEEWSRLEDPERLLDTFSRYGRQAGLSDEKVRACLTDEAGQRALVEQYREYYEDPRLTGTPTLVVDGEKVADWSFESLSDAIDAALGES
ncbi:MAG TPA: DsbA family protein [Paracoccaceae bacterium]|nr:DsbA family protein [Paracoccaceae bacterium]